MEERRAALIEDCEFLIRVGEASERIVKRLGYNDVQSLRRFLHRNHRSDLASYFTQDLDTDERWWKDLAGYGSHKRTQTKSYG